MRYGVLSDIHSNLEALQAVRAALNKEKVDLFLCPGDIVGYGANPEECTEIIQGMKASTVAGNHDWAVIGQTDVEYFNPVAKAAIIWTQKHISSQVTQFLKNLPLVFRNEEICMVHAALPHPDDFDYLTDKSQAQAMFACLESDLCFIGHTHVPFIIKKEPAGRISVEETFSVKREAGCQYVVNVGSVGQPRDGNPQAAYCLFDSQLNTIQIKRVDYDIEKAQEKITAAGLPVELAMRLALGR